MADLDSPPTASAHYIRVDFSSVHYSFNQPFRFPLYLKLTSLILAKELSRTHPSILVTLLPGLYVFSHSEAQLSVAANQHRGTFLLLLEPSFSSTKDNQQQRQVLDASEVEAIRTDLQTFEQHILAQPIFDDMPKRPSLAIRLVTRQQL
ncbi:hypothetical protein LTS18_013233, partial [Coniosporium uncinatum]